jgi:hypothetical protein
MDPRLSARDRRPADTGSTAAVTRTACSGSARRNRGSGRLCSIRDLRVSALPAVPRNAAGLRPTASQGRVTFAAKLVGAAA